MSAEPILPLSARINVNPVGTLRWIGHQSRVGRRSSASGRSESASVCSTSPATEILFERAAGPASWTYEHFNANGLWRRSHH